MAQSITIPINADRLCAAIAKIGYTPPAALMDIVDNSVAAGATSIIIQIVRESDKLASDRNNIVCYRIFDNGLGMTEKEILDNAFTLGAKPRYAKHSLSKFGMGLKSAGFALGNRITVLSKKEKNLSKTYYVDRELLDGPDYKVFYEEPETSMTKDLEEFLDGNSSGTLVQITKCNQAYTMPAKKVLDELQQKLGVVYYAFLTKKESPLEITVLCTGYPPVLIQPLDMMFIDEADPKGFNKDEYDCKTPCNVLSEKLNYPINGQTQSIQIDAVVFPEATMERCPVFTPEERSKIKSYKISKKNSGFYIYRNNRLICWSESIKNQNGAPLINRDLAVLRVRLMLTTEDDDFLHVDVSKQRLDIPDDFLDTIVRHIQQPIASGNAAMKLCAAKMSEFNKEGQHFNETAKELYEEDIQEPQTEQEKQESVKRTVLLEEETKKRLEESNELPEPTETIPVTELPIFKKVRYSDHVSAGVLWEPGFDPREGSFVLINKNHIFYNTVLTVLSTSSSERQAIEALLWTCASAENFTVKNFQEVNPETIMKVLHRFKETLSYNLGKWASENQNLSS